MLFITSELCPYTRCHCSTRMYFNIYGCFSLTAKKEESEEESEDDEESEDELVKKSAATAASKGIPAAVKPAEVC